MKHGLVLIEVTLFSCGAFRDLSQNTELLWNGAALLLLSSMEHTLQLLEVEAGI